MSTFPDTLGFFSNDFCSVPGVNATATLLNAPLMAIRARAFVGPAVASISQQALIVTNVNRFTTTGLGREPLPRTPTSANVSQKQTFLQVSSRVN